MVPASKSALLNIHLIYIIIIIIIIIIWYHENVIKFKLELSTRNELLWDKQGLKEEKNMLLNWNIKIITG